MKKILSVFLLLLLVGCMEPTSPVKDTTSNIDNARLIKTKQDVSMLIDRAEQEYIMKPNSFTNKCLDIHQFDNSYTGRVCYEKNIFSAFNIENEYYICNGGKSSLECIKIDQ